MESVMSAHTMRAIGIPFYELVGYCGSGIFSIFLLPQIYKSLKTKSTNGISVYMLWLHFVAIALMLYYSWSVQAVPNIIANTMCLLFTTTLLVILHKYSRVRLYVI